MVENPLISIITINYNHREGLEKTFASIFSQTWQEFEFIVIDGGSTDGSKELIENNQNKINYWVSEPDNGVYHAMNKGIKVAKGKYLNFMNSGDCFFDEKVLEKSIPYFRSNKSLYFGDFYDTFSKITKKYKPKISFRELIIFSMCHQAIFFKKSLFFDYFLYNETSKISADLEFIVRIICQYNESYDHLPFLVCRYEGGGLSSSNSTPDSIKKHKLERKMILENYFSAFLNDYAYLDEAIYLIKQLRRIGLIQLLQKFGLFKNLDDRT